MKVIKTCNLIFVFLVILLVECVFAYTLEDAHNYTYFAKKGKIVTGDYWLASYTDDNGVYHSLDYWVDSKGFAQRQCTSYAAFVVGLEIENFNNSFGGKGSWSHGKNWDDAAKKLKIKVDGYPLPGDVAYWENPEPFGHVAYVEKVHYDDEGNPTHVDISEYNYAGTEIFGKREGDKKVSITNPSGFIHIIAYYEDTTADNSFYLDRYEMSSSFPEQTPEEWSRILYKVWKDYKCDSCISLNRELYASLIEDIEIEIGMGGGTDDPDDPTIYTQDEDSDLHIKDFHLAIYGTDHWEHRVEQQLYPGQSFQIEGEARIENDSDVDADDVDIDYRVDHGKNFDTDDTKLDEEDLLDIDPGEYVTKHMGRTTISLSQDGLTVIVQGPGRSESFDVEDDFCKIYFFVDVENDDDDDISSNSDSDEYGVVEVTVIPFTPKFTATPKVATGYETVVFTDQTEGTVHTYLWDFGDGSTSNDPNPAHYYGSYGTFPVKLTVSDYTFTASTSQTITINQPDPSITITSPTKGEKWRSDKDRRIRWTWANLPYGEPIKIEYSCTGGVSWRTIYDGYTTNDGKKTWKMDKSKTKDTSNGYIRILRRSNGQELGRSPRFKIDHASGDPKW